MKRYPELEEEVVEALQTVYDPEIPYNIYDLGLIYGITIDDQCNVAVDMTLTSPGCPVADSIVNDVRQAVKNIHAVQTVDVHLVFDPIWDEDKMTTAAKLELGLL